MRKIILAAAAGTLMASTATAETFGEVTIGVPVASIDAAEAWYSNLFGPETEIIRPFPGVVEFKAAPGVWFQIFEAEDPQTAKTVVRFLVDDMAETQRDGTEVGIDMGEAIAIPEVVTYSEFSDPDGNALGLYDLP